MVATTVDARIESECISGELVVDLLLSNPSFVPADLKCTAVGNAAGGGEEVGAGCCLCAQRS